MASGSWLPWPLSIPGTLHHHSWILSGYVHRVFLLQHLKFVENGGLNSAHLNNFEHAVMLLMFFIYGVCAYVSETTRFLPLPQGSLHIIAGMAFMAEYLLFYFHSTSHVGLEGCYHVLLVILIGLCIVLAVLGAVFPKSFTVDLASNLFVIM